MLWNVDFRVTPNPNFMLDVDLDVEFDNKTSCLVGVTNLFHANAIIIYIKYYLNSPLEKLGMGCIVSCEIYFVIPC